MPYEIRRSIGRKRNLTRSRVIPVSNNFAPRSFSLVLPADAYSLRVHISGRSSSVRKQKHRFLYGPRTMDFRYAAFRVNSVTVSGFALYRRSHVWKFLLGNLNSSVKFTCAYLALTRKANTRT